MIPNTISDIFQPRIDFSYGLDVEIRPKLTPSAGTQVQYSTALWLHSHAYREPQIKFCPKWVHMARYELTLRLEETHGSG